MVELRFSTTLIYENITSRKREGMKKGKHKGKTESFRCMELEMSITQEKILDR